MRSVACAMALLALGCTYKKRPPPRKSGEVADERVPVLDARDAQARPRAAARALPPALSSVEPIAEAVASGRLDELDRAHAARLGAEGDDGTSAAALEAACEYQWRRFELKLAVAVDEHVREAKDPEATPEDWGEVERRWGALANRAAMIRQSCMETVPGSQGLARGLALELMANVGAGRDEAVKRLAQRFASYHPEHAAAAEKRLGLELDAPLATTGTGTGGTDDRDAAGTDAAPTAGGLLSAAPPERGVESCDQLAAGELCLLRTRLPDDAAAASIRALLTGEGDVPRRAAACNEALAKRRAARTQAPSSWCFAPDGPPTLTGGAGERDAPESAPAPSPAEAPAPAKVLPSAK